MARNASASGLFDDLKFPAAEEPAPEEPKPKKAVPAFLKETPRDEWEEKFAVKKSFFLTQQNMEALRLRHTLTAETSREYSRIINEALSEYLEEEIQALEKAYPITATPNERYYMALTTLSKGKK